MTVATPLADAFPGPLDALVQCLEDEYRALLDEDYQRLEQVLARKQQLLTRLAEQPAGLVGSPQGDRARAGAKARLSLRQLRNLNDRNARVLAPRAAGNRARLQFLQSALGQGALYGADGSVSAPRTLASGGRSA
jgi:flagellar biosynthesis/type III secretory pathway chaperone